MIDFVVVGGGIAGVSAAAFLAERASVVLVERERSLAYHTSGRSAAMLVENYGSAGARPMVKAARPFLESPPEGSVDSPLLSDRPVVWVAGSGSMADLESHAAKAREAGANCVLLSPSQVLERVPVMSETWLEGGLFEPAAADIDVAGLHQAYVRIARGHGVDIVTEAPVTGIRRDGRTWVLTAGERTLQCGNVVNAAGAWGDQIAAMAGLDTIGLQPMRRTAFMVTSRHDSATWPMVVDANEQFYFRPDGTQFLCSLAEEVPSVAEDARPRMEDVALAIQRINEATTLDIRSVNSQWTGLRTFAPDRDLVIGEDPTAPGFYWLVGQGGIGIQTSPAYGSLLASMALDTAMTDPLVEAGVDPTLTHPARFR